MTESPADRQSARSAAGIGAVMAGFLFYVALAGIGGGADWEDRLTFDQGGELELEGLGIALGFVVAIVIGVPLGAYIALRRVHVPAAGRTAWAVIIPTAAITALAVRIVPTGPADPVLLPYAVFGSWFLVPFLTRWVIERGLKRDADLAF
jgi:hypothetical protein